MGDPIWIIFINEGIFTKESCHFMSNVGLIRMGVLKIPQPHCNIRQERRNIDRINAVKKPVLQESDIIVYIIIPIIDPLLLFCALLEFYGSPWQLGTVTRQSLLNTDVRPIIVANKWKWL